MESYQRYGAAVLRKAERLLQNQDDAQDVVQSVFVELLSLGKEDVDLAYLFRVVTHRCLNLMRDRQNRERLLKQQQPALRGMVRTACDETVIGLDLLVKLSERLDPATNEVLVYRFYDDMTQEEIATIMGLSRRSVNRRLEAIREAVSALQRTNGVAEGQGGVS